MLTNKRGVQLNRKTATKLLLVQWSRFQNVCIRLEGSTLFTGVNGSGKSTVLDAMTYLLTGNTQFNKAAKDRDRTVLAYVRGDTKSNGSSRYLRTGEIVSYIVMEFWSPVDNANIVIGVCIESANETSQKSNWFICRDAEIDQMNFVRTENQTLRISPRNELTVRTLKSNIMAFPRDIEDAKRVIAKELEAQGIHTEVRVFAELVQEVRDVQWREAIETFLGRKRFYIIVEERYCHKAMEILQNKKLHSVNVVITDKLPDTEITAGSAAEVLTIPNVFARRYANYLLNGIHLCHSLEELHEYPKGGLMKNGMLAKSYAVTYMNLRRTEMFLGSDAIQCQLKRTEEERVGLIQELKQTQDQLEKIQKQRDEIKAIDWNAQHYEFQAAARLRGKLEDEEKLDAEIDKIRNNPDFTAVLQEREDARREHEKIRGERDRVVGDVKACADRIRRAEKELEEIVGEIYILDKEYSHNCMQHLELKRPMLNEYEKLRAKRDSWLVITPKTVQNLQGELAECVKQLENIQFEYCKLAEIDINKRGVAYIPFYREEYRNIANIKIEEAHQRLNEQAQRLESAFMNDFVAEINETIQEARTEIDAINRELKQIPFGNDTYRFVMKEKADRSVFFQICRKLESYMNSPEAYMNSARDDEEMEHNIQEFMNMILDEEDESEYTDYRKYFVYDMEISSRQGTDEIVADLSKKQGSASNGEKQTPYFIILAASLLQCYPKRSCCIRLAFIDEAFSALSRERIEQMVKYFEENDFQVIYAAPPEKISSIGTFIQSTVSLIITGRYTNAVEGLVREDDSIA